MEIYEKLENAIAAYLTAFVGGDVSSVPDNTDIPASWFWPESLKQADGSLRIFTGQSDQVKDGQAIIVIAEDANQEEPQFTNNFMVPVQIWLRTPLKTNTAKENQTLTQTAIENHSAAAALLSTAMNQDAFALAAAINAAGSDVTIMGGIMDLKPQRSEMPNFFASGWSFRVYAMGMVAA